MTTANDRDDKKCHELSTGTRVVVNCEAGTQLNDYTSPGNVVWASHWRTLRALVWRSTLINQPLASGDCDQLSSCICLLRVDEEKRMSESDGRIVWSVGGVHCYIPACRIAYCSVVWTLTSMACCATDGALRGLVPVILKWCQRETCVRDSRSPRYRACAWPIWHPLQVRRWCTLFKWLPSLVNVTIPTFASDSLFCGLN